MLIGLPQEMRANPKCYTVKAGKGYIPTNTATADEKRVVEEFNKKRKRNHR